jgi:hypothetical protein
MLTGGERSERSDSMHRTLLAALTFVSVLTTAAALHAGNRLGGGWTQENRAVGNKVTIEVYRRTPYALTGKAGEAAPSASGEWKHETRQLGNKVSIDVYRR